MTDQKDPSVGAAIGCFVVLVVVVLLSFIAFRMASDTWSVWQQDACARRWPDLEVRWEFWNGCSLEIEEGRWVPERNYRVLE